MSDWNFCDCENPKRDYYKTKSAFRIGPFRKQVDTVEAPLLVKLWPLAI